MLTTEQLDALRILAGWGRRLYEADSSEAYFRQCDELRKPWFAPGSLDPFGNIWDEEATAPDWQTIRPDLAAALEADAVAPLGERGKVRGAVLEVVRDAAQDPTIYVRRVSRPRRDAWALYSSAAEGAAGTVHGPALQDDEGKHVKGADHDSTLLAAIDHLAKQ